MRILVSVAVAVVVLAAEVPLDSQSSQAAPSPFSITIRAEPNTVKAGADVWLKIKLTNTSNHDVDCSSADVNGVDMRYQYDVRSCSGSTIQRVARSHPELASGSIRLCTLKPGESTIDKDGRIGQLFSLTQPGTYVIQVLCGTSDNEKDGVVKSNKITVTVRP